MTSGFSLSGWCAVRELTVGELPGRVPAGGSEVGSPRVSGEVGHKPVAAPREARFGVGMDIH